MVGEVCGVARLRTDFPTLKASRASNHESSSSSSSYLSAQPLTATAPNIDIEGTTLENVDHFAHIERTLAPLAHYYFYFIFNYY